MSEETTQPNSPDNVDAQSPADPAAMSVPGEIDPSELAALAAQTESELDAQFNVPTAETPQKSPSGSQKGYEPQAYSTPDFPAPARSAKDLPIEMLDDVELDVRIELGRTEMYIEDVLYLDVDSVVELDKIAGDPVDIYVSERLIARGEVLVLNECFCVRISEILSPIPELENDQ